MTHDFKSPPHRIAGAIAIASIAGGVIVGLAVSLFQFSDISKSLSILEIANHSKHLRKRIYFNFHIIFSGNGNFCSYPYNVKALSFWRPDFSTGCLCGNLSLSIGRRAKIHAYCSSYSGHLYLYIL